MRFICALPTILLIVPFTLYANDSWPRWGGPNGNFRLTENRIADSWPETGPKELWRRDIGGGYTHIVAEAGTLYTAYKVEGHEVITAIAAADGKTVWEFKYPTEFTDGQVLQFGKGPNTPMLLHRGHLYMMSFDSQFLCLNAETGKPVWRKHLAEEMGAKILRFGAAAAPVVYQDMVMVLLGGDNHGAVGFDLKTGEVKWKSEIIPINYAAPALLKVGDVEQMVVAAKDEAVSFNLADGKILWRVPLVNPSSTHAAQPLFDGRDRLVLMSQKGAVARTYRLAPDGRSVSQISENNKFNVFYSNAILVGDTVYGANGKLLSAMDIRTGKMLWRERGYDRANLVQVGDKWIILTETGKLTLARLSPEKLEVLASREYLTKPAWSAPTILGNRLYMRDTKTMIALDLGT
ncbi:MAG: PQQ-binding-like beta-propeller repeat protein [Acidobacteriota bacterium]|nr:PQQ-binding-like beta-propeller repeat protein [Acidobacteriota bacterium]